MKRIYWRIAKYLIVYPLLLSVMGGYVYISWEPTYNAIRSAALEKAHRIYEKEHQRDTELAMIELGNLKIPAMPAREAELPR